MANVNPTSTTIEQYREAKNHYLKLKNQAKKELVARFNALAAELLQELCALALNKHSGESHNRPA